MDDTLYNQGREAHQVSEEAKRALAGSPLDEDEEEEVEEDDDDDEDDEDEDMMGSALVMALA